MQIQEQLARKITLEDVRAVMAKFFKAKVVTPEKLLASLNKDGEKAILVATKCGECENTFLTLVTGYDDVMLYKNYEVWNVMYGDGASCPECDGYDCLFFQHHTCKVVFDNTGIPNLKYTLGDIKDLQTPFIEA